MSNLENNYVFIIKEYYIHQISLCCFISFFFLKDFKSLGFALAKEVWIQP